MKRKDVISFLGIFKLIHIGLCDRTFQSILEHVVRYATFSTSYDLSFSVSSLFTSSPSLTTPSALPLSHASQLIRVRRRSCIFLLFVTCCLVTTNQKIVQTVQLLGSDLRTLHYHNTQQNISLAILPRQIRPNKVIGKFLPPVQIQQQHPPV